MLTKLVRLESPLQNGDTFSKGQNVDSVKAKFLGNSILLPWVTIEQLAADFIGITDAYELVEEFDLDTSGMRSYVATIIKFYTLL